MLIHLLFTSIALLILLCFFCIRRIMTLALSYVVALQKQKTVAIGILAPSRKKFQDLFIESFILHLRRYATFTFETVECDGQANLDTIRQLSQTLLDNDVDLIYVLGKPATRIVCHQLRSQSRRIPVVSGGTPIETIDIPLKEYQADLPFTAVTTTFSWNEKIASLKKTLPHAQTVLVLFCASDVMSAFAMAERNAIATAGRKYQLFVRTYNVDHIESGTEITQELLTGVDAVIISRCNSRLIGQAQQIARDAARWNVPVLSPESSHASSVFLSTECSVERRIGAQCARQAIKILEGEALAEKIPLCHLIPKHIIHLNLHQVRSLDLQKAAYHLFKGQKRVTLMLK